MSLELSESCCEPNGNLSLGLGLSGSCCTSGNLSLGLSLNGNCCTPVRVVELSGSISTSRSLIRITSTDFADATNWHGANTESVTLGPTDAVKVYDNNLNRWMDEGTEWDRTADGVHFTVPGFDSTTIDYKLYIHIN